MNCFKYIIGTLLLTSSLSSCAEKKDDRLLEYPTLQQHAQANQNNNGLSVIKLNGEMSVLIYENKQKNYLFETFQTIYLDEKEEDGMTKTLYKKFVYKIAPSGEILGIFELKDDIDFYGGYSSDANNNQYLAQIYLVGEGAYSNWLTTSDSTIHKIPLKQNKMNFAQFKQYYLNARAAFISQENKTITAITADGKWEYIALDFTPYTYMEGMMFDPKQERYTTFALAESLKGEDYFNFSEYPQTVDSLTFDGFKKGKYIKKRLFDPMGYPSYRTGTGFFTIKIDGSDFKFSDNEKIKQYDSGEYTLSMPIQGNEQFKIIDKSYIVRKSLPTDTQAK